MALSLLLPELKVFSRALHALAKLGSELFLEFMKDELSVRTISSSKSCYADIRFGKSFFESYSVPSNFTSTPSIKVSAKSICKIFTAQPTREKNIRICRILVSDDTTHLYIENTYLHSVVKLCSVPTNDCPDPVEAVYSIDNCKNHLSLSLKVLLEVINNFRHGTEDITLSLKPDGCVLQNYASSEKLVRTVETQLNLAPNEFDRFSVALNTQLTFSQKDLRAALQFGELVSQNVNIWADQPGSPIVFSFTDEVLYSAHFVQATMRNSKEPASLPGSQQSRRSTPSILVDATSPAMSRSSPRLTNDSRKRSTMLAEQSQAESAADRTNQSDSFAFDAVSDPMDSSDNAFAILNEALDSPEAPPIKRARSRLFARFMGEQSLREIDLDYEPSRNTRQESRVLVPDSDEER